MQLALFGLVDETVEYFNLRHPTYEYAREQLISELRRMIDQDNELHLVNIRSRIKSAESLREKMIRNKFYLDCHTPQEALANLHDLIGITLQCRFIRNEEDLYNMLFRNVDNTGEVYSRCIFNRDIYLNLEAEQPQIQRNGFQIYRIDGYFVFNNEKINFELQIKSLVHNFWSEIEHEVVYKNPYFVMYDKFNREMLGAIRDNLDVVDRQLEIMYNEITRQSKSRQIGMDDIGFKLFLSQSINELVNRKMKESLGFASDFRKCSSMIAQYVFVNDFINNDHGAVRMVEYMTLLNSLNEEKIDFKEEISLGRPHSFNDPFSKNIGKYFEKKLNSDFQWHVFFAMLFLIQPGNNLEDFMYFVDTIKKLIIEPKWFNGTFSSFREGQTRFIHDRLLVSLSKAMCDADTIEIVHEDKLIRCMEVFHDTVTEMENRYTSFTELNEEIEEICDDLYKEIRMIFQ